VAASCPLSRTPGRAFEIPLLRCGKLNDYSQRGRPGVTPEAVSDEPLQKIIAQSAPTLDAGTEEQAGPIR